MSPRKKTHTVTIRDIATAANVSVSTVSNVLSGKRQVKSNSGKHVLEVAKELGYKKNTNKEVEKVIRFVLYKKYGRIVVDTAFFSELTSSIAKTCRRFGYALLITVIDLSLPNSKEHLHQIFSDNQTPLLLLATEMDDSDIKPFLKLNVPLLVLDSLFPSLPVNTVHIDNYMAGYLATSYLIKKGHHHIGIILSSLPFNNMSDRQQGFEAALCNANLSCRKEDIIYLDPTVEDSKKDMDLFLQNRSHQLPLPSAFFAANDILAMGASQSLKSHGYLLPTDISIIGMDNMPFCLITDPPLTTLQVSRELLGAAAVERLIDIINSHDDSVIKTAIGSTLIERSSVIDRSL